MLEKIISIAEEAGIKIIKIYDSPNLEVSTKKDSSPITQADLIANEVICNALKQISTFPILSEENPVPYSIRKDWDTFWLVDPLDGTKDFIAHNGEFTVNIALIKERRPILGVIALPATKVVYFAEEKQGAFKKTSSGLEKIFHQSIREKRICAESRFHPSEMTLQFCRNNKIEDIKQFGSSLKLCKIAEGEIDVYPRYIESKEWDIAAAHCILNEAGCEIIDLVSKKPVIYNKENIPNNSFIAASKAMISTYIY